MVLAELARSYLEDNLIWKIQGDVYKRELERYGGSTIDLAEDFFYSDSEMVTGVLKNIKWSDDKENLRWLYAVYLLNFHLDLFKYTKEDSVKFLEQLRNSYLTRLSSESLIKKQLSSKFRANRRKIEQFLRNPENFDPNQENIQIMQRYARETERLVEKVNAMIKLDPTTYEVKTLSASLIHMTMNRLFRTKSNLNEMVCYDLLAQLTKSELARAKSQPNN